MCNHLPMRPSFRRVRRSVSHNFPKGAGNFISMLISEHLLISKNQTVSPRAGFFASTIIPVIVSVSGADTGLGLQDYTHLTCLSVSLAPQHWVYLNN